MSATTTPGKLKDKLLQVMHERNQGETLTGRIEIDDVHLGCERPGERRRCATMPSRHRPGSRVVSDSLGCFGTFDTPAYRHERFITGGDRASMQIAAFNWVNTVLGNVKNAIHGQHVPRYLTEFEYRFNRRYDPTAMIPRFLTVRREYRKRRTGRENA